MTNLERLATLEAAHAKMLDVVKFLRQVTVEYAERGVSCDEAMAVQDGLYEKVILPIEEEMTELGDQAA